MIDALKDNFFNPDVLLLVAPSLFRGLVNTILLALLLIPLGMAAGLLLAVGTVLSRGVVRFALFACTDVLRAFPPLVLMLYVYYGLPMLGVDFGALGSIAVALTLNTSSYFGEIFRAGIESVPRGQWEAARATGLSWGSSFVVIILPQGIRAVLPDVMSNVLTVTQLTSLASVVEVPELLKAAMSAQGTTYNASPLIAAALIYLALLWPLVWAIRRLEGRFHTVGGVG